MLWTSYARKLVFVIINKAEKKRGINAQENYFIIYSIGFYCFFSLMLHNETQGSKDSGINSTAAPSFKFQNFRRGLYSIKREINERCRRKTLSKINLRSPEMIISDTQLTHENKRNELLFYFQLIKTLLKGD